MSPDDVYSDKVTAHEKPVKYRVGDIHPQSMKSEDVLKKFDTLIIALYQRTLVVIQGYP